MVAEKYERQLLAVPDEFRQTALAFPGKVRQAITAIDDIDEAADGLAKARAMADYAEAIKASREEINSIQYGKLLLAAKVGELAGDNRGRPKKGEEKNVGRQPTLFHKDTLVDYRKLWKYQKSGRIDSYWDAVAEENHDPQVSIAGFFQYVASDGNLKAHQNKGVIEWYTPKEIIEAATKAMGGIDLDPASNAKANKIVKATTFYSQKDNGLEQEWAGKVFLNPPFKADLITAFVGKLCSHHEAGEVPQAVLLTNNNTDTKWWHQAAGASKAICFTVGRIAFYNAAGAVAAPTNGHTLFYFGNRLKAFQSAFKAIGLIMQGCE